MKKRAKQRNKMKRGPNHGCKPTLHKVRAKLPTGPKK